MGATTKTRTSTTIVDNEIANVDVDVSDAGVVIQQEGMRIKLTVDAARELAGVLYRAITASDKSGDSRDLIGRDLGRW